MNRITLEKPLNSTDGSPDGAPYIPLPTVRRTLFRRGLLAPLYLPTYKAEESRVSFGTDGRRGWLVGFKVRDDGTGEDAATGLRITGSYNNCSTWTD